MGTAVENNDNLIKVSFIRFFFHSFSHNKTVKFDKELRFQPPPPVILKPA